MRRLALPHEEVAGAQFERSAKRSSGSLANDGACRGAFGQLAAEAGVMHCKSTSSPLSYHVSLSGSDSAHESHKACGEKIEARSGDHLDGAIESRKERREGQPGWSST